MPLPLGCLLRQGRIGESRHLLPMELGDEGDVGYSNAHGPLFGGLPRACASFPVDAVFVITSSCSNLGAYVQKHALFARLSLSPSSRNQVSYHQIHTNFDYIFCMQSLTDLAALVEKYAAAIPDLNLDGDELEEYSTMLLWLQNTVETGEPSETIVKECLAYFAKFESRAA